MDYLLSTLCAVVAGFQISVALSHADHKKCHPSDTEGRFISTFCGMNAGFFIVAMIHKWPGATENAAFLFVVATLPVIFGLGARKSHNFGLGFGFASLAILMPVVLGASIDRVSPY